MDDRQKTIAKRHAARISDYKEVFGGVAGKRVLYDMMLRNFVMSQSFVPNDPYTTAYNQGQRDAVMQIITILKSKPKDFEKLIMEAQEHNERERSS